MYIPEGTDGREQSNYFIKGTKVPRKESPPSRVKSDLQSTLERFDNQHQIVFLGSDTQKRNGDSLHKFNFPQIITKCELLTDQEISQFWHTFLHQTTSWYISS